MSCEPLIVYSWLRPLRGANIGPPDGPFSPPTNACPNAQQLPVSRLLRFSRRHDWQRPVCCPCRFPTELVMMSDLIVRNVEVVGSIEFRGGRQSRNRATSDFAMLLYLRRAALNIRRHNLGTTEAREERAFWLLSDTE